MIYELDRASWTKLNPLIYYDGIYVKELIYNGIYVLHYMFIYSLSSSLLEMEQIMGDPI